MQPWGCYCSPSLFSGTATLLFDGTSSRAADIGVIEVFAPGEQADIWVFNSQNYDIANEWALLTNDSRDGDSADDWVFPALPLECGCGTGADSLEWRLSDAFNPDFGGVNTLYGSGNVSNLPGDMNLQTAILPEPSTSLLILASALLFRLKRRTRRLTGRESP